MLLRLSVLTTRRTGETHNYKTGDRAWLSTRPTTYGSQKDAESWHYISPFKVLQHINDVTYKLELMSQLPSPLLSCLYALKHSLQIPLQKAFPPQPPAPLDIEGELAYTVKEILDSQSWEVKLQYLIDWEGYRPEERWWVVALGVLDPLMCQKFHAWHPSCPCTEPRGRHRRKLTLRVVL